MLCLRRCLFSCSRLSLHAARAVKARPSAGGIPHDRAVHIGVVNHIGVNAAHSRVIPEGTADPLATIVAAAVVTVSVVDSTVEPDRWAPVTLIEDVAATAVAPIARRPEKADLWRKHPGARHPVIAEVAIGPIARSPNVAGSRAERLRVERYRRRREPHRYGDIAGRRSQRQSQEE